MQKIIDKTTALTFVFLLAVSMVSTMVAISPTAYAHTPAWTIPTWAYINVAPNPVGIGQSVTVGFWLHITPPTASGALGDRFHNFTITITKPNGQTEVKGPYTSDATGGTYIIYTPDQLGNYTFVFSFPGQVLANENPAPPLYPGAPPNAFVGDYFGPSTSSPAKLTVQQDPIQTLPLNPLPTSYWTRPVEAVNYPWSTITGNWLGLGASTFTQTGMYNATGNYNPYTTAPNTAHILWTKVEAFGGLVGGEFGGNGMSNYYSTSQYEPKYAPIIMNGILYYTQYPGSSTSPAGWVAVDLRTGQTLWTKNTTWTLKCGQELNYVSPNQYGNLAYLWATSYDTGVLGTSSFGTYPTTFQMFDALTGNYILSIVNSTATAMTLTEDDYGNLIGYYVNSTTNYMTGQISASLTSWNSSQAILYPTGYKPGVTVPNWQWRPPQGTNISFSAGIMWSVPLANNITNLPFPTALSISAINSGVVLLISNVAVTLSGFQTGFQIEAGYSSTTGQQLWLTNRTETPFTKLFMGPTMTGNGVYVEVNLETAIATGFSLNSGSQLWATQLTPVNPYDSIGGYQSVLANGVLYLWSFGGNIYAIDLASGNIIWRTDTTELSGDAGADTPYGVWPLWTFTVGSVADGKLFIPEGHQYAPPLFRGANQLAINITNGKPVWNIMSFDVTSGPAIADGIMTAFNAYDNQIYAYGKGPSKLTVSTQSFGTPIVISGSVTDISAGSQQLAVAANFPNGLPVVSDASMTQWMQYVYMQQQCPTNVTGVPVSIYVLDSNGNYRQIGSATTDGNGAFSYTWTPDIPGDFKVTAAFAGSESYYPSSAETFFTTSASAPTASPTPILAVSIADQYFVPAIVGLFVFVAIIGATIMLMLRKRA